MPIRFWSINVYYNIIIYCNIEYTYRPNHSMQNYMSMYDRTQHRHIMHIIIYCTHTYASQVDKSRDEYYIAIHSHNHCTRKGAFLIYIRVGSLVHANKVRDDRPVTLPGYNIRIRFESNVVSLSPFFMVPLAACLHFIFVYGKRTLTHLLVDDCPAVTIYKI